VRADGVATRAAAMFAVAAVAGLGVTLGCASDASARRATPGTVQTGEAS